MASLASITIVGNLGAEAATKVLPTGQTVVEFPVAVNSRRGGEERTAWYRVSCFGKLAESLDKLAGMGGMGKGRQVVVDGRLEPREFTDKTGQTRTSLDVVASEVVAVGARGAGADAVESADELPW